MKIKIAIVEDEPAFIEQLSKQLRQWAGKHQHLLEIKSYTTSDRFLMDWEQEHFDMIYFDIMLPHSKSGVDLAKYIRSQNDQTPVVFLTSLRDRFNEGFRVSAVQYLIKPAAYEEIEECMDTVSAQMMNQQKSVYCYSQGRNTVSRIPFHDILYFSGALQYVEIHTVNGVERQLERLKNIEETLPEEFVRCHRSFIVNIGAIYSISSSLLTLIDRSTVPISKSYFENVKRKFMNYFKRTGNT